MRGGCGRTDQPVSVSLAISSSLSDIPDDYRCPVVDVIEQKRLVEAVFAEYQCVKRLGIRHDMSIHPSYLVALDIELQAIERKDAERREKARKAKQMQPRRR